MDFERRVKTPEPFSPFFDQIRNGRTDLVLSGLRGGSIPMAMAKAISEAKTPALIVVKDPKATRSTLRDLAFFLGGPESDIAKRIRHYPALDVSPYESISPHNALIARRMATLAALQKGHEPPIIVAPAQALMERVIPRDVFVARTHRIPLHDLVDRDEFAADLVEAGYMPAPLTEDYGDFSIRGGIVDLFCPMYDRPIRMELDDIEVVSLRFFNPSTQVSKEHLQFIEICPPKQILLSDEGKKRFAVKLKALTDSLGIPKGKRDQIVEQVEAGIFFPGIEFFMSLFFDSMDTLFDYLPEGTLQFVVEPSEVEGACDDFEKKVNRRNESARKSGKPACDVQDMYLTQQDFEKELEKHRQIRLGQDAFSKNTQCVVFPMEVRDHSGLRERILNRAQAEKPLAPLVNEIENVLGVNGQVILVSPSRSGVDRLERMLLSYKIRTSHDPAMTFTEQMGVPGDGITVPILLGDLSAGFSLPESKINIICEEEIFGEKKRTESVAKFKGEVLSSFADLAADDYVVHLLHGVGIYRGLVQLTVGAAPGEYLLLEYARGDKLYLPVYRLSQVQRFVGSGGSPTVDRLGGQTWEKTRAKARISARKIAKELINLYAKRASRKGFAFASPDTAFSEFEATFPFEETPDQLSSIRDVTRDMTDEKPMDRLVCGDVGFGKTEVALRAAFLAVHSGKQVAVLVPTTTLAFQHYRSFAQRLSTFGINVRMLSRFTPAKQVSVIRKEMESGKVDVVVGTHKLLGNQIVFADLGLLVVDEEQHFGVVQKEKIKQLKDQVDVLSLTATPIPRTLNMALSGIRDLSVINTAPEDRLAIRTFITHWEPDTLREAINRELKRGGQIFFVHNRIKSIDQVAQRVRELAPDAKIQVIHGQMDSQVIEKAIMDFTEQKFDILVSTAIVESGLDFPMANTIFINRADILGLSQLYQLRGRVGRAKRRAYCYLITPDNRAITKDARRRLGVLRTFTELGSGYKIAARDMEIRGAGNLLGEKQSGQISAVGLEMFTRLLEDEIRRLRGEEVKEQVEAEISLPISAFLPEDYVNDVGQRLSIYKRLSDAEDLDRVYEIYEELKDRYGPPPNQVINLIKVMEIKIRAKIFWIKGIEAGPEGVTYIFDDRTPVRPSTLVALATLPSRRFLLSPDGRLIEKTGKIDEDAMFECIKKTLQGFA